MAGTDGHQVFAFDAQAGFAPVVFVVGIHLFTKFPAPGFVEAVMQRFERTEALQIPLPDSFGAVMVGMVPSGFENKIKIAAKQIPHMTRVTPGQW